MRRYPRRTWLHLHWVRNCAGNVGISQSSSNLQWKILKPPHYVGGTWCNRISVNRQEWARWWLSLEWSETCRWRSSVSWTPVTVNASVSSYRGRGSRFPSPSRPEFRITNRRSWETIERLNRFDHHDLSGLTHIRIPDVTTAHHGVHCNDTAAGPDLSNAVTSDHSAVHAETRKSTAAGLSRHPHPGDSSRYHRRHRSHSRERSRHVPAGSHSS